MDPDTDCLPTSHYPTAFGPPDQSADVNTQAHRARCYPRGSESSDKNEVDTRPMTSAPGLMTSMPFLYGYMSPPCSLPFPGTLPVRTTWTSDVNQRACRTHCDLLPFISNNLLYSYLSQLWQLMFSTFALPKGDCFLLSFGLFVPGGVVLQGFTLCYSYQCPSLEGQAPKQLTNQQYLTTQTILAEAIIPRTTLERYHL